MAIQLLMSAGRKTRDRSLMIISRSESRNSSTRFRFVFDENTSSSYGTRSVRFFRHQFGQKEPTSITFWWCNSRRYLTSRIADMSSPSLNWPTLIFLMATFLPVATSRPGKDTVIKNTEEKEQDPTSVNYSIGSFANFLILRPRPRTNISYIYLG